MIDYPCGHDEPDDKFKCRSHHADPNHRHSNRSPSHLCKACEMQEDTDKGNLAESLATSDELSSRGSKSAATECIFRATKTARWKYYRDQVKASPHPASFTPHATVELLASWAAANLDAVRYQMTAKELRPKKREAIDAWIVTPVPVPAHDAQ